ncbi:MAG: efflux RND transporter permease subunit [Pseudomonadota bacterium]
MKGLIDWFARNDVTANLLMLTILGAGFMTVRGLPLEVFPAFDIDVVNVRVPFPGATPVEVEQGITIKVEEAIYEIEGIKRLRSTASEGLGTITAEVDRGYDPKDLLEEIKVQVDAISTFPVDAEKPVVYIPQTGFEVIDVVLHGSVPEAELRKLAERVRDDVATLPGITQVSLSGVREYEISIEVSAATLREYGLTFDQVAQAIRRSSLDLSAGQIRSPSGDIVLRTEGQAYERLDFERIVVRGADGTRIPLSEIAVVRDGFSEEPVSSAFDGQLAAVIEVDRVGDQSAIEIAATVKDYVDRAAATLPAGVAITVWDDNSEVVKARLGTLTKSAIQGGLLILILLTLFLRWSVALWVVVGIPVCFMGGIALMPTLGVTINLLSLFAFILVLGIVVDDAIVTGENIYSHLRAGAPPEQAAIRGTQEIAVPVTFGVLTTVAAFTPLLFIEGTRGKLFAQFPLIVIPVLLFSLVESKLILPAHLKHARSHAMRDDDVGLLTRVQRRIADSLEWFVRHVYQPFLDLAIRYRYVVLASFVALAMLTFATVASGNLRFIFFPRVPSETATASLTMPTGTSFEVTRAAARRMSDAADALREEFVDPVTGESVITHIYEVVGGGGGGGFSSSQSTTAQSNVARVLVELTPAESRPDGPSTRDVVASWRKRIGTIPGAEDLNLRAEFARGGAPIDVQLTGQDFDELRAVAASVRERLATYPGVFDVTDDFEAGKAEIELALRPQAEPLGLTLDDLASQVRQAFFGLEVQRVQRGREEVRVYLRYPRVDRESIATLEAMTIRTASGADVPFEEVALATKGRGFASITRVDRTRKVSVTADVDKESADVEGIKADLNAWLGGELTTRPTVRFTLEGEAAEQRESFGSVTNGALFVLFAIYVLLAVPFRSYLQPLIVMLVIPFGVIGAMLGHMIMGLTLSFVSVLGMLALSGVVVNDSLVLVDYVNQRRREGASVREAVYAAGGARFRPVLLTSLTTFAGLMPLIFEKSTQAQFLVPMAVSLGFGILFATAITLLLIPMNYLVLDDLVRLPGRVVAFAKRLLGETRPAPVGS